MIQPVIIAQVNPQFIHDIYPFLLRGMLAIKKRVPADSEPEDVYAAIRNGGAQAHIISRGERRLGFIVTYKQTRPFSGRKELFLWLAWSIPLRERQEGDNVPDAVEQAMAFMREQARATGCDSIVHMSSRRGFEKFGFRIQTHTYRLWL